MATTDMGIRIMSCIECQRMDVGNQLYTAFRQGPGFSLLTHYDRESGVMLVNKDELMRLIQMVNPAQKVRPLRLATFEKGEWKPD